MESCRYVIVGGGIAAAAAVEGIRALDRDHPILLLTRENHAPYQRPLLTKDLWYDPAGIERLPVHSDGFYAEHGVRLLHRRDVAEVDPERHRIYDDRGEIFHYERLLLATGSRARRLDIAGDAANGLRYYRDLEDYFAMEAQLDRLQHVTLLGGSFTGIELAAAFSHRGKQVTFMFPDEYPLQQLLPRDLGLSLVEVLRDRGIEIAAGEMLSEIAQVGEVLQARTRRGNELSTQLVVVDAGAVPQVELAEAAGLALDDGIVVDEFARTSAADIWAAGDVAEFPYPALGQLMRIECADHAVHHGRCAGANMAGASEPYRHLPAIWFRLFDLRLDGVGQLDPRLDVDEIWITPGREGVIYYMQEEAVRGVLLCGLTERLDWARALVREARVLTAQDRRRHAATAASRGR